MQMIKILVSLSQVIKHFISITEMSRSTIIRALKSLEEVGLLRLKNDLPILMKAKRQTSNLYTLKVGYQADTQGSVETPSP